MGYKYIIEIPEDKVSDFLVENNTHLFIPYSIAGYKRKCDTRLSITPYTEPDLEQVRKEGYKQGIADAWGAARQIIHMPEGDLLNVFTECYSAVCTALQVILKYDASEAIEKLKAYEQDAEIKVGDEVKWNDTTGDIAVVTRIYEYQGYQEFDGIADSGEIYEEIPVREVVKTGRNFPEIAAVLEKMRGEQDD